MPGGATDGLSVRHLDRPVRVEARLLRRIAWAALDLLPSGTRSRPAPRQHEVAFHLAGDRRMAALNEQHLGHGGPTDVITFDYGVPVPSPAAGAAGLRGDVFIGVDVARRQAREFGTTWTAEVVRYLVHGLLHLQGYDDLEPAARRVMKREENRLVRALAIRFDFRRLARRARLGA
jgi:probable rRNA maturation factor